MLQMEVGFGKPVPVATTDEDAKKFFEFLRGSEHIAGHLDPRAFYAAVEDRFKASPQPLSLVPGSHKPSMVDALMKVTTFLANESAVDYSMLIFAHRIELLPGVNEDDVLDQFMLNQRTKSGDAYMELFRTTGVLFKRYHQKTPIQAEYYIVHMGIIDYFQKNEFFSLKRLENWLKVLAISCCGDRVATVVKKLEEPPAADLHHREPTSQRQHRVLRVRTVSGEEGSAGSSPGSSISISAVTKVVEDITDHVRDDHRSIDPSAAEACGPPEEGGPLAAEACLNFDAVHVPIKEEDRDNRFADLEEDLFVPARDDELADIDIDESRPPARVSVDPSVAARIELTRATSSERRTEEFGQLVVQVYDTNGLTGQRTIMPPLG